MNKLQKFILEEAVVLIIIYFGTLLSFVAAGTWFGLAGAIITPIFYIIFLYDSIKFYRKHLRSKDNTDI